MQSKLVTGTLGRLYRNVGTGVSPVWDEVGDVREFGTVSARLGREPRKPLSKKRQREQANRNRREVAAELAKPLPIAEQLRRAEANRAAHQKRYPSPPKLDPLAHVRGDPRLRDEPPAKRPVVRDWVYADLLDIFDVSGAVRFRKTTGYPPQKKAA